MGEETGCRAGRCVANNMGSKAVVDALPPPILALFTPRPPIMHLKYPPERKCRSYDGMAQFTNQFEDPSETPPKPPPLETKEQKKKRKQDEAIARGKTKLDEMKAKWDPKEKHKDGDAYKTLFVGRLSYDATEKDVLREFENYGPVKSCTMVKDDKGKPRGYCFIEFERERDMRNAFKQADGRKINGRRVVVDVERGRTVNNWLPRKLGGGLGGTRKGGKDVNQTFSGREPPAGGYDRATTGVTTGDLRTVETVGIATVIATVIATATVTVTVTATIVGGIAAHGEMTAAAIVVGDLASSVPFSRTVIYVYGAILR